MVRVVKLWASEGRGNETVYSLQGWDGAEIRMGKGTEMMIAGIGYLLRHDGRTY